MNGPNDSWQSDARKRLLRHVLGASDRGVNYAPDSPYELTRVGKCGPHTLAISTVYGRHASPQGIKDDMEKYNSAVLLGWFVLRFERDMIMKKENSIAVDTTLRALHARGWRPK